MEKYKSLFKEEKVKIDLSLKRGNVRTATDALKDRRIKHEMEFSNTFFIDYKDLDEVEDLLDALNIDFEVV